VITLVRLDHLVLTVRDVAATCRFYERVLGMETRTFGNQRIALHFVDQKINLHDAARPIDPNVRHAAPGSADLCFLVTTPMPEILAHLEACGVPVVEGVGRRTGATGPIMSVYVYDPDENLIEIAVAVAAS
jgi:catechol 2,3-dioxygenase-like lactoylglutathione lyase family enzyme